MAKCVGADAGQLRELAGAQKAVRMIAAIHKGIIRRGTDSRVKLFFMLADKALDNRRKLNDSKGKFVCPVTQIKTADKL
ncbi:MAG: hypothetical protein V7641_870 [Blastocatellia bacterium]